MPIDDLDEQVDLETWERKVFEKHGVPEGLRMSIFGQESGGGKNLTSPTGVKGRYQVTQRTAKQYGLNRDDPWEQPIAAAKYLREGYEEAKKKNPNFGDREAWLAASARYYGGPGAFDEAGNLSSKSLDGLSTPAKYAEGIAKRWSDWERSSQQPAAPRPAAPSQPLQPRTTAPQVARQKVTPSAPAMPQTPQGANPFSLSAPTGFQQAATQAAQRTAGLQTRAPNKEEQDFQSRGPLGRMAYDVKTGYRQAQNALANQVYGLGETIGALQYGDTRPLKEQATGAGLGLQKLIETSTFGAPRAATVYNLRQNQLAQERRRASDPYWAGSQESARRDEARAQANPTLSGKVVRGVTQGAVSAAPILATGAVGGTPAILGMTAATQDYTRPEEAALNIASTALPIKAGQMISPLAGRVAGKAASSVAGQEVIRRGIEAGTGGATNAAQYAAVQKLRGEQIDPEEMIAQGVTGAALGTAMAPSRRQLGLRTPEKSYSRTQALRQPMAIIQGDEFTAPQPSEPARPVRFGQRPAPAPEAPGTAPLAEAPAPDPGSVRNALRLEADDAKNLMAQFEAEGDFEKAWAEADAAHNALRRLRREASRSRSKTPEDVSYISALDREISYADLARKEYGARVSPIAREKAKAARSAQKAQENAPTAPAPTDPNVARDTAPLDQPPAKIRTNTVDAGRRVATDEGTGTVLEQLPNSTVRIKMDSGQVSTVPADAITNRFGMAIQDDAPPTAPIAGARQQTPAPAGRRVRVGNEEIDLTPEQAARWAEEVEKPTQESEARYARARQSVNAAVRNAAESRRRADAMRIAAKKREIADRLTGKEQAAADRRAPIAQPPAPRIPTGPVQEPTNRITSTDYEGGVMNRYSRPLEGAPIETPDPVTAETQPSGVSARPTKRMTVRDYAETVDMPVEDRTALDRALRNEQAENPRAYGDVTRPGEPGSGGVSFSPYNDLVSNNRAKVNQLFGMDLNSPEAQGIIADLEGFAANRNIEPRHVENLLNYIKNDQIESARRADGGDDIQPPTGPLSPDDPRLNPPTEGLTPRAKVSAAQPEVAAPVPASAPKERAKPAAPKAAAKKEPWQMTRDKYEESTQGATYGDWYFTPEGKYVQMRGSGGMGSNRVGALDINGKLIGYYDRDELRLANKSRRTTSANSAADDWLADVSKRVRDLKTKNEALLLNAGITETFKKSLAEGRMTQEQYDKALAKGTILNDRQYAKAQEVLRQIDEARNTPLTVPENKEHRRAVEKAIAEGKPVPAEVLADYPDLAPKTPPPAVETRPRAESAETAAPIPAGGGKTARPATADLNAAMQPETGPTVQEIRAQERARIAKLTPDELEAALSEVEGRRNAAIREGSTEAQLADLNDQVRLHRGRRAELVKAKQLPPLNKKQPPRAPRPVAKEAGPVRSPLDQDVTALDDEALNKRIRDAERILNVPDLDPARREKVKGFLDRAQTEKGKRGTKEEGAQEVAKAKEPPAKEEWYAFYNQDPLTMRRDDYVAKGKEMYEREATKDVTTVYEKAPMTQKSAEIELRKLRSSTKDQSWELREVPPRRPGDDPRFEIFQKGKTDPGYIKFNVDRLAQSHERIIKDALRMGETVSPEVLADYPDLVKESPAPKPSLETPQGETASLADQIKNLDREIAALDARTDLAADVKARTQEANQRYRARLLRDLNAERAQKAAATRESNEKKARQERTLAQIRPQEDTPEIAALKQRVQEIEQKLYDPKITDEEDARLSAESTRLRVELAALEKKRDLPNTIAGIRASIARLEADAAKADAAGNAKEAQNLREYIPGLEATIRKYEAELTGQSETPQTRETVKAAPGEAKRVAAKAKEEKIDPRTGLTRGIPVRVEPAPSQSQSGKYVLRDIKEGTTFGMAGTLEEVTARANKENRRMLDADLSRLEGILEDANKKYADTENRLKRASGRKQASIRKEMDAQSDRARQIEGDLLSLRNAKRLAVHVEALDAATDPLRRQALEAKIAEIEKASNQADLGRKAYDDAVKAIAAEAENAGLSADDARSVAADVALRLTNAPASDFEGDWRANLATKVEGLQKTNAQDAARKKFQKEITSLKYLDDTRRRVLGDSLENALKVYKPEDFSRRAEEILNQARLENDKATPAEIKPQPLEVVFSAEQKNRGGKSYVDARLGNDESAPRLRIEKRGNTADTYGLYTVDAQGKQSPEPLEVGTLQQTKSAAESYFNRLQGTRQGGEMVFKKPQPEVIEASADESQRIETALKKEKLQKDTGLSKSQEKYLSEKLANAIPTLTQTQSSVTIKVPGDGQFTVETPRQANRLHKKMSGEYIEGAPRPDFKDAEPAKPKFVADAEARLKDASSGKMAGSGARQFADVAIVTGYKAYKAGMKFAEWSKAVIKEAGEDVRPHLRAAWEKITSMRGRDADPTETGGRVKDVLRRVDEIQGKIEKLGDFYEEGDAQYTRGKQRLDAQANKLIAPLYKELTAQRDRVRVNLDRVTESITALDDRLINAPKEKAARLREQMKAAEGRQAQLTRIDDRIGKQIADLEERISYDESPEIARALARYDAAIRANDLKAIERTGAEVSRLEDAARAKALGLDQGFSVGRQKGERPGQVMGSLFGGLQGGSGKKKEAPKPIDSRGTKALEAEFLARGSKPLTPPAAPKAPATPGPRSTQSLDPYRVKAADLGAKPEAQAPIAARMKAADLRANAAEKAPRQRRAPQNAEEYFAEQVAKSPWKDLTDTPLTESTNKEAREALRKAADQVQRGKMPERQKERIIAAADDLMMAGRLGDQKAVRDARKALFDATRGLEDAGKIRRASATAWDTIKKATRVTQTLAYGTDVSFAFRQAAPLSTNAANLLNTARAFKFAYDALGREAAGNRSILPGSKGAESVHETLKAHPMYDLGQKAGLELTLFGKAEEVYADNIATKLPWIKRTEAANEAFLDYMRLQEFQKYVKRIDGNKDLTGIKRADAIKQAAEIVNTLTGRTDLGEGAVKRVADAMNGIMAAPRLNVSRLQLVNPVWWGKQMKSNPQVARQLAGNVVGIGATWGSLLALGAATGAFKVNLDPEDKDFGKIVSGETRYDITGGMLPVVKLVYQAGKFAGAAGEEARENTQEATAERKRQQGKTIDRVKTYLRGRLGPLAAYASDLLIYGEDFQRRPVTARGAVTPSDPNNLALRFLPPLGAKSAFESYQKSGAAGIAKTMPAEFFGIGARIYDEDAPGRLDRKSRVMGEADSLGVDFGNLQRKKGEPDNLFKQRSDKTNEWFDSYGQKLLDSAEYKKLDAEDKKKAIRLLRSRVGSEANQIRPNLRSFEPGMILRSLREGERRQERGRSRLIYSPEPE